MSPVRCFIALALPEAVRAALGGLVEPLTGVIWTPSGSLHLTLRFLGDVPEEQIPAIETHLATVRVEPFVLPVEGVGAFPPKSPPRVLWCGVGRGHPRLHQLRQRVDDALIAAGLSALNVRTFHPHVTLARCHPNAARPVATWLQRQAGFVAPPLLVEAFDLYASELRPTGAVQTLLRRFALAK